jgi:hypothetical protein
MSLFKKKPGGTFLGNLLRTTVNKASGGVMGTGANMLPLSPVAVASNANNLATAQAQVNATTGALVSQAAPFAVSALWAKYKMYVWILLALVVGFIIYKKTGKKNQFAYKKRY